MLGTEGGRWGLDGGRGRVGGVGMGVGVGVDLGAEGSWDVMGSTAGPFDFRCRFGGGGRADVLLDGGVGSVWEKSVW